MNYLSSRKKAIIMDKTKRSRRYVREKKEERKQRCDEFRNMAFSSQQCDIIVHVLQYVRYRPSNNSQTKRTHLAESPLIASLLADIDASMYDDY